MPGRRKPEGASPREPVAPGSPLYQLLRMVARRVVATATCPPPGGEPQAGGRPTRPPAVGGRPAAEAGDGRPPRDSGE